MTKIFVFPWHVYCRALLAVAGMSAWLTPVVFEAAEPAKENYRLQDVAPPSTGRDGFTSVPASQTGIRFTNHLADATAAENQIRLLGSGVALGDVDADGLCDVYLCRLQGGNRLYRNLGAWRFQDVTPSAKVACDGQFSTGCVFADVDGDRDSDLLVNSIGGGTRLFINNGKGQFAERMDAGLSRSLTSTSMTLADVDADGDLDLYVANYRTTTIRSTGLTVLNVNGQRVLRPEDRDQYEFTPEGFILEHGEVDFLYLNDGSGRFTTQSWTNGAFLDEEGKPLVAAPKDWGLSALFYDINNDGAPDLYVCNDFWSPDQFWINNGKGKFQALPRLAMRNSSTFSMGIDCADINRDGQTDFMVLDMLSRDHQRRMRQRAMAGQNFNNIGRIDDRPQVERNTLYLNRGNTTFSEIANYSDVAASEWSWGLVFLDVDLDGFEDILITTGHGFDTQDNDAEDRISALGPLPTEKIHTKLLMYPRLNVPNVAFRNRGDLTFEEKGREWGFNAVGVSHGIALGDLDNDGDLDTVVNNLNQEVALYRNESARPRIAIRLRDKSPNTQAVGARIIVHGGPAPQSQQIISGGRYLSGDFPERVFAAGTSTNRLAVEVLWPQGGRTSLSNLQANAKYIITNDASSALPLAPRPPNPPLFEEVRGFQIEHNEEPFDDFERQKLLPRRLSQLGPGLAWFDFDSDGWDDLLMAAGRGGRLGLLRNRGGNNFDRVELGAVVGRSADDQTAVIGWPTGPGSSMLLVATGSYETTNRAVITCYEFWAGGLQTKQVLPLGHSSPGPMAVTDLDIDGDLDLFVGGRVMPGRYPESPVSRLYRRDGELLVLAAELTDLGMVSGAVFSDLDDNGRPDLILASEWGPIKVLMNDEGKFRDATDALGFGKYQGWWNGVTTGDFDGDGRIDIAASNWGRNHPHAHYAADGIRLYYGDLARAGNVETVVSVFDKAHRQWVTSRDFKVLGQALPWMQERFANTRGFSEASLEDALGDAMKSAKILEVTWLDSTVFFNRGKTFEARSLPPEAQFAPAFGICAADADGDGHDDLFLAQNFFAVAPAEARLDGGQGLWLRGDGRGAFRAITGEESGIEIHGEQRAAAVGDFDNDGRVDLVVAQNAAPARLYRGTRGHPALRVRLKGPAGNPVGVGARMRLASGANSGPIREVRAGSGYWAQDGAVQLLSGPSEKRRLIIRWPGGREQNLPIADGLQEVAVSQNGILPIHP